MFTEGTIAAKKKVLWLHVVIWNRGNESVPGVGAFMIRQRSLCSHQAWPPFVAHVRRTRTRTRTWRTREIHFLRFFEWPRTKVVFRYLIGAKIYTNYSNDKYFLDVRGILFVWNASTCGDETIHQKKKIYLEDTLNEKVRSWNVSL